MKTSKKRQTPVAKEQKPKELSKSFKKTQAKKSTSSGQRKPQKSTLKPVTDVPKFEKPLTIKKVNTPLGVKSQNSPKGVNTQTVDVKSFISVNSNDEKNNKLVNSRKRSAILAGIDNGSDYAKESLQSSRMEKHFNNDRAVKIFNLPKLPLPELLKEVADLMKPRGKVEKVELTKQGNCNVVVVLFKTVEEARAAKKLNGVIVRGRHLSIAHSSDRDVPHSHKVCVSNVPKDLTDEDIWCTFGGCGNIVSIKITRDFRTKEVQRCFVTFETQDAAERSLSVKKTLRNRTLLIKKDCKMFPVEDCVFIPNCAEATTDDDLQSLFSTCGLIQGINRAGRNLAIICFKEHSDVEKALTLNGTVLNGVTLQVQRHKKFKEVSGKRVKLCDAQNEESNNECTSDDD